MSAMEHASALKANIIEDDNHVGMAMIVIGSHEADVLDPKHTTCLTWKEARIGIFSTLHTSDWEQDIR